MLEDLIMDWMDEGLKGKRVVDLEPRQLMQVIQRLVGE